MLAKNYMSFSKMGLGSWDPLISLLTALPKMSEEEEQVKLFLAKQTLACIPLYQAG